MQVDIKEFEYKYLEGPVENPEELENIKTGNCRLALQIYFYKVHNLFFQKEKMIFPGNYKSLGKFIYEEEKIDFDKLVPGDIVFAQNLIGKNGNLLQKDRSSFDVHKDWLLYLHTAIYLGKDTDGKHYIWHATSIEGKSVVWDLEKFNHYYLPISVKRAI